MGKNNFFPDDSSLIVWWIIPEITDTSPTPRQVPCIDDLGHLRSAIIPNSCLDGCPCPGGKWSISLDRKPVVWFSPVLSKPPDQGLLDQPIAHHRRRKEIYIFWRRSCTVETDEQAHFVSEIKKTDFKEQDNSANKNNLESNLIVRPQCVSVWREKI